MFPEPRRSQDFTATPTPDTDTLAARYHAVRAATEQLAAPLSPEDCVVQSMPDASPVKWHLAHTSWFFETFVLGDVASYEPFDPEFAYLYNSYYNAVGDQYPRPERGLVTRPSLGEIREFRAHVDAWMNRLLEGESFDDRARQVVVLGLQHEQQHQELILTDVKHLLGRNPRRAVYRETAGIVWPDSGPQGWRRYEPGIAEVGTAGDGFSFDNESPRHRVYLNTFDLALRPITNREYLDFVTDGGYGRPELWLSDGWAERKAKDWNSPLYWSRQDGLWRVFTLSGLKEINLDEPVCHVSYYEADAYARWCGARLPTEFEWEFAAAREPVTGNFAESGLFHPQPATSSTTNPIQLFGDVWEWTASAYLPYPGYRPVEGALGEYNGKFMCNQFVLRGGSCATPKSHIRPTYRNFFPPAARWQFSGIRLARDAG